MAIYRGSGSTGAASPDTYLIAVTEQVNIATQAASDAVAAVAGVVDVNAAILSAANNVILTNADVLLTSSDAADAETARVNTEALFASFNSRYLGAKSVNPALDNEGEPLAEGALHFNVNSNLMKVYVSSGGWLDIGAKAGGTSSFNFVASGALPDGTPVILNNDGTVTAVQGTLTTFAETIPLGSPFISLESAMSVPEVLFDPNDEGKFILVYSDQSNQGYGTAIVGTVTGGTISFGAPTVFNLISTTDFQIDFDPHVKGRFVITFGQSIGGTGAGTAVVGSIVGSVVSFGSLYTYNTRASGGGTISFDPNGNSQFVIAFRDNDTLVQGRTVVGTVEGTTLSFGAQATFHTSDTGYPEISFDPNDNGKFVIVFKDGNNPWTARAIVGSRAGNVCTYGTAVVLSNNNAQYPIIKFDPSEQGKFVVLYQDNNGGEGLIVVGTVTGLVITWGVTYTFSTADTQYPRLSFVPQEAGTFVIAYADRDNAAATGIILVASRDGDVITWGYKQTFSAGVSYNYAVAVDPNTAGKFVITYNDPNYLGYGSAILGQVGLTTSITNLTPTNFIGISTNDYIDADVSTIMLDGGVSLRHTGIIPNARYYILGDGTLSTEISYPTVALGKGISTTSILMKNSTV